MAYPVEPTFGRAGEYSTHHSSGMYHGTGLVVQEPVTFWHKMTVRADSVRDALGDKCCRCLHHMPSLVLIIGMLIIIGLAIAAVPIAFIVISNASSVTQSGDVPPGGSAFVPIRTGLKYWPKFNENPKEDESMRMISTALLFPSNVSLCHGFGFACTTEPSRIVSSAQRCDGKTDCPDGSDELHCRACQTPHWCELTPGGERLCVRAVDLCNGKRHCPTRADEATFCRAENERCPEKTRRCTNEPLCLSLDLVCDGEYDCRSEEDEQDCTECVRGAKMCAPTRRCISRSKLCDGIVQCPDGSDELNCDCKACSGSDRALCSNGRCLDRRMVCDGTIDCEGGLDEDSCPGTCRDAAGEAVTEKTIECSNGRFYPASEACSGQIRECASSCPTCDAKLTMRCKSGMCLPKMRRCDGLFDCSDGDDEVGCEAICKEDGHFKCTTGRKCISASMKCDGVRDCVDGSDERNCTQCPPDALRCDADQSCFPRIARCDGVRDCSDGSDESECSCEECAIAHSDTYACEATPHCFARKKVCAPHSLCPNATSADKLFCAAQLVSRTIF